MRASTATTVGQWRMCCDQGVAGHQRPRALEKKESVLALVRREDGQHARTDEVENEVRARLGGQPSALCRDERREDEQGTGNLDDLVHENLLRAPSSGRVRRVLSSGRPPTRP